MKTTFKRPYEKPAMTVYQVTLPRIICTSSSDPNWWNQPGGPGQL